MSDHLPLENQCKLLAGACQEDNESVVRQLLEQGAPFDMPDEKGWTALHYAAHCSGGSIMEMMLQAQIKRQRAKKKRRNLEPVTDDGSTPLLLACHRGDDNKGLPVVRVLLGHGANME